MKPLLIFFVLLGAIATTQSADRNTRQPRIEIIIPNNTNLFLRTSPTTFVFRAGNDFSFNADSAGARTNLFVGRTNQLNSVGLTNSGRFSTPTNSLLIGPVFPAPVTNLAPTGRGSGFDGFEGVGAVPAPLVTNAFGNVVTNSVTGSEVPGPAAPGTPPNTTPLAPPTAPNIPQPTTPSTLPNPNAPPSTPSSPNPTPPNTAPLNPPAAQPLPPTSPAPPAPPGGNAGAR